MIKTLSKVGIQRMHLNMITAIHDKLTANIIFNGEKLKASPLDQEQNMDAHSHHFYPK